MINDKLNVCGCGNPVVYHSLDGKESCNKYKRCPSYDELMIENRKLKRCEKTLILIRDVDAMDYEYKTWASKTLEGEGVLWSNLEV